MSETETVLRLREFAPEKYNESSPLGAAIQRGYENWAAGNCHEPGCGCVTVYIYEEVRAALAEPRKGDAK